MIFSNIEAEQQLLGCILIANDTHALVADLLGPDDFAEPLHGRIYDIAGARIEKGHLASPVTMRLALENDPALKELGGPAYLARMAGAAMSPNAARDYARSILEASCRRRLHEATQEAASRVSEGEDSGEVKMRLLHALSALPEAGEESSYSLQSAVLDAARHAVDGYQGKTEFLKTGLGPLDRIIKGLAPGDNVLLGGATSMGKAQPLTSMVLALDGWKAMGDVRVGDRLASVDGAESVVTGIFPQGERQVYRVTFKDGRSVRCCGEHLWEVGGSFMKRTRVISTEELAEKLKFSTARGRITVPLFKGEFGAEYDLPVDPWALGAFIGNGHFPEGGNPMFSTADASTLWRFANALGEGHEVVAAGGYDYRIRGRERGLTRFAASLDAFGLRGCRAETKFIPVEYMRAGNEVRREILQGLLDTDGWVESFGAVRYSTSSAKLADQVQELVRSLGGTCTINQKLPKFTHKGENRVGQVHYVLNVRHDDAASLFSVLPKKRRCGRVKPVTLTIVSIEPDGVEPVQCIKVSHPRQLYVTDGFTITHNTSVALEIAKNAAFSGKGVAFVSLEMTRQELATRIISQAARVPYANLRDPEAMEEDDFRKWVEAAKGVGDGAMRIIPKHVRDIPAIHSACKRAGLSLPGGKVDLVVVDYAQLVRGPGKTRYEQMTEVSIGLKHMAGLLGCPVISLVQLSRDIGNRDDKRPQLSDIKETGQYENDADFAIFCHRESYWLERQGPKANLKGDITEQAKIDWKADLEAVRHKIEFIVRKNRHGRLSSAEMFFHAPTMRFAELRDAASEFM